jgi:hypothetical protein
MLHPDFPVVTGRLQVTEEWAMVLPMEFNRRTEDGDLVIWRPGFTIWIAVWRMKETETAEERRSWIRETTSPRAYDMEEGCEDGVWQLQYRLAEEAEDRRHPALYCYAVGSRSEADMAFYFDREEDLELAQQVWCSLSETRAP